MPVRQSALGILLPPAVDATRDTGVPSRQYPPALRSHELLVITKANTRSTVHRSGYLDYVGVKRFDADGRAIGETRILGLVDLERLPRPIRVRSRGCASSCAR